MKTGSFVHSRPSAGGPRIRWGTPLFFAGWTAAGILILWWLGTADSDRLDLLIELDRADAGSWAGKARRWVSTRVEVYWAYAWVLLAPYVIWLSLRFAMDRRRLAWRLAMHLVMGAGFVIGSQALTQHLVSLRPKSIFITGEEVIRHEVTDDTNEPTTVVYTRTVEWHARPDRRHSAGPPSQPAGLSPAPQETNLFSSDRPKRKQVIPFRGKPPPEFAGPSFTTSSLAGATFTNVIADDLARRLAPIIEQQLNDPPDPGIMLEPRKFATAPDALAYLALIGLAQAVHFRRRLGEREIQAAALEARLTQTRLHVLQAQLQPHFLFNALNGIATLVRRDARTAEEMLTSLSDLLRASLSRSGRQEIPLREELSFLDHYLELQQMRFGDRLRVERHIEPDALDCLVPSLLLQPLIENAIRHGLEPSPNPGVVRIEAGCEDDHLLLCVEDNGVGLGATRDSAAGSGNGLGLSSIRERLSGLYGDRHEFTLQETPGGGVSARIKIPKRITTPDSPSPDS